MVLNIVSWCVEKQLQSHYNLGEKKTSVPAPPPPVAITAIQLNNMQHALSHILFWGKCAEEPRAFLFSTLYQSNENGYDDYMCKCTKSLTLQR